MRALRVVLAVASDFKLIGDLVDRYAPRRASRPWLISAKFNVHAQAAGQQGHSDQDARVAAKVTASVGVTSNGSPRPPERPGDEQSISRIQNRSRKRPLTPRRTRFLHIHSADYIAEDFIERVHEGKLHLDYEGFESKGLGEVPLEHARWFTSIVSPLTIAQLRSAFEAAGATPQEVDGYSNRLAEKIAELQKAVK
jgi:hypothetical protein